MHPLYQEGGDIRRHLGQSPPEAVGKGHFDLRIGERVIGIVIGVAVGVAVDVAVDVEIDVNRASEDRSEEVACAGRMGGDRKGGLETGWVVTGVGSSSYCWIGIRFGEDIHFERGGTQGKRETRRGVGSCCTKVGRDMEDTGLTLEEEEEHHMHNSIVHKW